MSILSDKGLLDLQKEHSDFIQPFNVLYLQPSSYDMHFRLNKGIIVPPVVAWLKHSIRKNLLTEKRWKYITDGLPMNIQG